MTFRFQLSATLTREQVTDLIKTTLERDTGHKVKSVHFELGEGYSSHPMSSGVLELRSVRVDFEDKTSVDSSGIHIR